MLECVSGEIRLSEIVNAVNNLDARWNFKTISEMTNYVVMVTDDACVVAEKGVGGVFIYDDTKSTVNNGGTNFNGWVRQYDGPKHVTWFGAKGDGTTNDTAAFKAAGVGAYIDEGKFIIDDTLNVNDFVGIGSAKTLGDIDASPSIGEFTHKKFMHEFDFAFPGYDSVLTQYDAKHMWNQGMYIDENKIYFNHVMSMNNGPSQNYIVIYNADTYA